MLLFLPARVLAWAGVVRPAHMGAVEVAGLIVLAAGAIVAAWCVLAFIHLGKGTPAPFDPPRRLVVRGPYRYVRNPMYLGATVALSGAALYYRSFALLGFAAAFVFVAHVFVVVYEEPTLRRLFGADYEAYCGSVSRWRPHRP